MAVLGYNVAGAANDGMVATDMHGHFDSADFAALGSVIGSSFQVNQGFAYLNKTNTSATNVQVGLYEASNPAPALWPLVLSSNITALGATFVATWVSFTWPVNLMPSGTYALSIIVDLSWSVWQYRNPKVLGPVERPGCAPGVLPNPLGATASFTRLWSLYIDYTAVAGGPTVVDPPFCCRD